jgi:RNA polymerase sigma-70 factor (ECF subfamily)
MRAFPAFQASAPHLASATTACLAVFFFTRTHARDRLSVMAPDASSPTQVTDEIIERCLNGDQAAWESIVRMYRRKVFNVAYKFVGRHDQAEDLTQDVFLKLYKSLDTFDRRANFQTWLISVSRNLCIDHYRAVRKERETINRDVDPSDFAPASPDTRVDTQLEQRDRVKLLRKALDKLAPTLRTAVMLRDIQELTYQEIADKLHLPEGTVKSRINRGRTELARQIQRLREEQDAVPRTGVSG